jgi:hypothetical protein
MDINMNPFPPWTNGTEGQQQTRALNNKQPQRKSQRASANNTTTYLRSRKNKTQINKREEIEKEQDLIPAMKMRHCAKKNPHPRHMTVFRPNMFHPPVTKASIRFPFQFSLIPSFSYLFLLVFRFSVGSI